MLHDEIVKSRLTHRDEFTQFYKLRGNGAAQQRVSRNSSGQIRANRSDKTTVKTK